MLQKITHNHNNFISQLVSVFGIWKVFSTFCVMHMLNLQRHLKFIKHMWRVNLQQQIKAIFKQEKESIRGIKINDCCIVLMVIVFRVQGKSVWTPLMAPCSRLLLLLQLTSLVSVGLACDCDRYPWSAWSACSQTCNHGTQHRQRWDATRFKLFRIKTVQWFGTKQVIRHYCDVQAADDTNSCCMSKGFL